MIEQSFQVNAFYFITPIKNIPSILRDGILSCERIESLGVDHSSIANESVKEARRQKHVTEGRSLTSYANLYFWPRNAMLYRVIDAGRGPTNEVAILQVKRSVLAISDVVLSAGNAASRASRMYKANDLEAVIRSVGEALGREFWTEVEDGERKAMAEVLVPDLIPPNLIDAIFVSSNEAKANLEKCLAENSSGGTIPPIIVSPRLFFGQESNLGLTSRLSLIKGDMFLSSMQTLTISVNCVGVMGRGLASRTKHQFPSVYVFYQDLCRRHVLKLGRPYLYKPEIEGSYLSETSRSYEVDNKWFLLFPTKQHWKYQADIHGIEKGLDWLVNSVNEEKIKSIAVPALGCGNGWLEWDKVGPLICRYLSTLEIPVELYLPAEIEIPEDKLTKDFLLKDADGILRF
jgi:O-acetyl-ADP-ribose deacetylase (regulator of RNase III)